ncbi:MAG: TonB-dependent siderophore receptor [Verrucomicrobiota bacterium]
MKHPLPSASSSKRDRRVTAPGSDGHASSGAAALAALFVAHGIGASAAFAQAAPAEPAATPDDNDVVDLPEVVVEGEADAAIASPKFTAPLLDTPQTVSVIPQEVFNQQGATNLAQILRNTPGISFNAGENGFSTGAGNFSMRGFDTSGSVFTDGFRDSGNHLRDSFNIEQVEVVKGPAADNGRGSGGGYVNLVSKTPHLADTRTGTASFGFDEDSSEPRYRATLDLNQSVSETAAVRLNLMGQTGGVPGRDVAENNAWGFAPSLALGLGTDTRVVFSYQHLEQDNIPEYGVPGAFVKGLPAYNPAIDGEANRDRFYGLDTDYDDVVADSLLARIEHDLTPDLRIANDTRVARTDRKARFTVPTGVDGTGTNVNRSTQFYDRDNESLANNTSLALDFATGSIEHSFVTGLELSREKSHSNRRGTNNPGATPVTAPVNSGLPVFNPAATSTLDIKIDSAALYAYDTATLNDRWQLTGGLRLERYKASIDNSDATPASYDVEDTTLGGKIGVTYKPRENGTVYAAFGVSALPPGSFLSNSDISRTGGNGIPGAAGINNPDAKTQYSLNYEIGTKWELFDERLTTTLAAFQTEKRNVAITGRDPNNLANTTVALRGYGEQIVRGIEFGASGRITEQWSVFGGLLVLDSERRHSAFLDAARRLASPGDYGTETRTDGDQLAFTPQVTANLWTTYRLPAGLTLGGGLQYVGESYLGRPDDAERIIPNNDARKVPEYFVVNAMVAYEVNDRLSLRLNVDNVFDEFYAVTTNWNGSRATIGGPRTYLLSADFSF